MTADPRKKSLYSQWAVQKQQEPHMYCLSKIPFRLHYFLDDKDMVRLTDATPISLSSTCGVVQGHARVGERVELRHDFPLQDPLST